MVDIDITLVELMVNYLRDSYPVRRFRVGRYFKRGISYGGTIYHLPTDNIKIFYMLSSLLSDLYVCDMYSIGEALSIHLGLDSSLVIS